MVGRFVTFCGQCTLCELVGWPSFVDCRILKNKNKCLGVFGVWRAKTDLWGKRWGNGGSGYDRPTYRFCSV